MKIFIGSSREAALELEWLAACVENLGHEAVRWDEPGQFPPGSNTFFRLIEISQAINGAIFIFREDDKVWYRGNATSQPRDNVLIEYGLFTGRLGPSKAIVATKGQPKYAADLAGITYIDITENKRERARIELRAWLDNLNMGSANTDGESANLFCNQLIGSWWERLHHEEAGSIGFFNIHSDNMPSSIRLEGTVFGADYTISANWKSVLTRTMEIERRLLYYWDGWHTKSPNRNFHGFGEYQLQSNLLRGFGRFWRIDEIDYSKTFIVPVEIQKASMNDIAIMASGNRKSIKSLVARKLQNW